ncbi:MAG: dehydrogenase [Prevotella sp.]|nr:dehydrogenase [Candidatus Equicola faecalis]MDO4819685.1 dehydrogenase [Prevotella sp.]
MADNYLEKAREDYEARKQRWLRRQSHLPRKTKEND